MSLKIGKEIPEEELHLLKKGGYIEFPLDENPWWFGTYEVIEYKSEKLGVEVKLLNQYPHSELFNSFVLQDMRTKGKVSLPSQSAYIYRGNKLEILNRNLKRGKENA